MGNAGGFVKDRYMGGKTFPKYFKEDVWPLHNGVFDRLGLTEARTYKLFRTFAVIDYNENGLVDTNECFRYFGAKRNRFTERLFFFEKTEPDNSVRRGLTFKEFAVLMWCFCTLSTEGIARYVFEIMDVDNNFYLSRFHIETIFRMLYVTETVDPEYLAHYPFDTDNRIAKSTFLQCSAKQPILIQPALDFQKLIRRKTVGVTIWSMLTQYRLSTFKVFDHDCDRLVEADAAIVRSVEDQAQESKGLSVDMLLEQASAKLRYDADAAQRELALRQKQQLIERRRSEMFGPDLKMKRAWANFEAKVQEFENEEFTTDIRDVQLRQTRRMELFDLCDFAISLSREYYEYKDNKDLNIAEGTDQDHEARYEDFVSQTSEGPQLTLLAELFHVFTLLKAEIDEKNIKNKYYREDNKTEKQVLVETNLTGLQKLMDPLFNFDPETVSLDELDKRLQILTKRDLSEENAIARNFASRKQWSTAKATAHTQLVQFIRQRTVRRAQDTLAMEQIQRERDFRKRDLMLVSQFGSRITKWEYVLDKKINKPFYVNNSSFDTKIVNGETVVIVQKRHPKTAFCEQCDAIMVQHELRCIECDAPRSAKNLLLYRPLGFKDITLE